MLVRIVVSFVGAQDELFWTQGSDEGQVFSGQNWQQSFSKKHSEEQLSPPTMLPSSHSSPSVVFRMPSPHSAETALVAARARRRNRTIFESISFFFLY
jgi:hypothetical protein